MTKTTREIEKIRNKHTFWITCVSAVIISAIFMVLYVHITLNKYMENVPKRVCYNETIVIKEPRYQQIECPCWKKDHCLMWCGDIIGYIETNKMQEVCEIK